MADCVLKKKSDERKRNVVHLPDTVEIASIECRHELIVDTDELILQCFFGDIDHVVTKEIRIVMIRSIENQQPRIEQRLDVVINLTKDQKEPLGTRERKGRTSCS